MAMTWNMKWRLAFLCVLGLLVGFAALCYLFVKGDQIKQANYEQIRLGTKVQEVQTILGSPGIDFSDESNQKLEGREFLDVVDVQREGTWEDKPDDDEPGRKMLWFGRDAVIMIRFGQDDRVSDKSFMTLKPLTFRERARVVFVWW
jgi:hypothetical protein